jgi:tripartite ATP-independent transporter DctM subunit
MWTLAHTLAVTLVVAVCAALMMGFPVAFTLAGVSLIFAGIGFAIGVFDPAYLHALPLRLYGTMDNDTLLAVPLFVFMGVMLERSKIAEALLETMAELFGNLRGGLVISVMLVGALLAASTGIVGATVVTMGLISLPTMLRAGYAPTLASGTIAAAGTLGQIIPPSVILVLLGDALGNAYQQAQLKLGVFEPKTVAVGDLFVGAIVPGALLVGLYLVYLVGVAFLSPASVGAVRGVAVARKPGLLKRALLALLPPLLLVIAVLGSIIGGIATPTEAAAVGAVGATLLALVKRELSLQRIRDVADQTVLVTAMVFMILIGASVFALVFRGFGGDDLVHEALHDLPGGVFGAMFAVMLVMFLLGFVLDFIEIVFVVVPLVAPVLLMMGVDPIWLAIMMAVNLQTSFLTPPFGFALFYLRGVAPPTVSTGQIYRGVAPFIVIQLIALGLLAAFPALSTWLPEVVFAGR